MAHIYADVDTLVTSPPKASVGNGQCVALIEDYTDVGTPAATSWEQGDTVRDNAAIAKGTAIATFVDGKYPSHNTGNHAAFFLSQDTNGIWVVDQYAGSGGIRKRHLRFKGTDAAGKYIDPSNNADAFSVIK